MSLLAFLIAPVLITPASAGLLDFDSEPFQSGCLDVAVMSDTVPYNVARSARTTHARTYSAINALQERALPLLTEPDSRDPTVFHMGVDGLMGVTALPSNACGEIGMQGYDVMAYNMVAAARLGRWSVFYSAAGNSGVVYEDAATRWVKDMGSVIVGHYYAFTAPLWGARVINADEVDDTLFASSFSSISSDSDVGGISLDYVVGGSVDVEILTAGIGYVGSQGLYVHVVQEESGAYLDVMGDLRDLEDVDPLRYLQTGLSALRLLKDQTSVTDANFARYQIVAPTGAIINGEQLPPEEETLSLTNIHQRNMLDGILDVEAAGFIKPTPGFFEARVRLHTYEFHTDLVAKNRGRLDTDQEFAGAIAVGLVNVPERPWYGVKGGIKPSVALEGIAFADRGGNGYAKASFLLNDPDTLTLFPYAEGAWQFHLSATLR